MTSKFISLGTLPAKTYGSFISWPLTVSFPVVVQQITRSPSTPTTRLTKYCFAGFGRTPTATKAALVAVGVLSNPAKQYLVKRVVGVAGDRVICCTTTGKITVNGEEMVEPYIYAGNVPSDMNFDVTVPKGKLWVMGDHRGASADSRYHQEDINKGFVPLNRVTGRVLAVIWPIKNFSLVPNVDALNQPAVKTKTK